MDFSTSVNAHGPNPASLWTVEVSIWAVNFGEYPRKQEPWHHATEMRKKKKLPRTDSRFQFLESSHVVV